LCQKGVTRWPLFLVNCLLAEKRGKTSRGAALSLSSRPPAVEDGRAPMEGGRGEVWLAELFTMVCDHAKLTCG